MPVEMRSVALQRPFPNLTLYHREPALRILGQRFARADDPLTATELRDDLCPRLSRLSETSLDGPPPLVTFGVGEGDLVDHATRASSLV